MFPTGGFVTVRNVCPFFCSWHGLFTTPQRRTESHGAKKTEHMLFSQCAIGFMRSDSPASDPQ